MKNKTLGIIFANMHDYLMGDMTARRSMASLPFGGRYRLVDFGLSAMVNANITKVGVIAKSNYQSLLDHLGSGRPWDLARKREGLTVFPPHSYYDSNETVYHGRIEALKSVLTYIKGSGANHVVMMDCDYLCNLDLGKILNEHIETEADVTIVCCDCEKGSVYDNCVSLKADNSGRINELLLDRCEDGFNLSMNVFVINKDLLCTMIEDAASRVLTNFERDVLLGALDKYNVRAYKHDGFVRRMDSLVHYFNASLALLERENMQQLFPKDRPVYTKVRDEAPVRYGVNSTVKNCLIADGCVIEGTAENCVLFRGVHVGKGAVLKNCILMQDTVVCENAELEYIITDRNVTILDGRNLVGHESYPVYVRKGVSV